MFFVIRNKRRKEIKNKKIILKIKYKIMHINIHMYAFVYLCMHVRV